MNERVTPVPQFAVPRQTSEDPSEDRPHGGRRWKRYRLIAGVSLALIAGVVAAIWAFGGGAPVQYITTPVTRGAITRTVTATGTVNPELTIIVGTYVSGVIQELHCDYNTEVKRGQICAKIDPRPYQTLVDQAKATLAVARAQLEKDKASLVYAKLAFDRTAILAKTNAVSQDLLDNARSTHEQAQAQIGFDEATIQQREAALEAAQVNLDYTNIVSPVDGTVVSRNVTMGQTVAASFQTPTLFLIASDLARMQVDTNVSEGDIGGIQLGDRAVFSVDAFSRRVFEGAVTQVRQSPQTVQNVVTYDVVIGVANRDLALKPGMTASTRVVIGERRDVIRIPNQALRYAPRGATRESDAPRVWVLRGGEPVAVQVSVGLDDDNFTEIVSGDLKPGEQVITAERAPSSKTNSPRFRL